MFSLWLCVRAGIPTGRGPNEPDLVSLTVPSPTLEAVGSGQFSRFVIGVLGDRQSQPPSAMQASHTGAGDNRVIKALTLSSTVMSDRCLVTPPRSNRVPRSRLPGDSRRYVHGERKCTAGRASALPRELNLFAVLQITK
jgi:hypothetical protein